MNSKEIIRMAILLGLVCCPQPTNAQQVLRLGTAHRSGNYYPLGKSFASVINKNQDDIEVQVIETKGSVDNIHRLMRGSIDLAIVQNDVAFFAENGLDPFKTKVKNLAGILTFYSEPVFILTNITEVKQLNQLVNRSVNIGTVGSGLYTDAKIILNTVNVWNLVRKKYGDPTSGVNMVLQEMVNEVHAVNKSQ